MNELKDSFLESMNIDHIAKINELINNHIEYYVYVSGKFYIPIPKADSIDTTAKKIAGIIRPTVKRGDVDNYIKLILDVLHDVVYDDDKNVIGITAEKYYSTEEIRITVDDNKKTIEELLKEAREAIQFNKGNLFKVKFPSADDKNKEKEQVKTDEN